MQILIKIFFIGISLVGHVSLCMSQAFEENAFIKSSLNEANGSVELYEIAQAYSCSNTLSVGEFLNNKHNFKVESKSRYGFSNNAYWFSFKTDKFLENKVLVISNPHLDLVDLFEISDQGPKLLFATGDKKPFNSRAYPDKDFVFEIGANTNYLLKVYKLNSSVSIPGQILSKNEFIKEKSLNNVASGIYFGTMLIAILAALLFSFLLKKRLFAWYAMYIACLWLYLFTHLGYSFQFFYPDSVTINSWLRLLMIVITFVVFIQFTRAYFQSKKWFKTHDKLLVGAQLIFGVLFVLWQVLPSLYDEHLMIMLNVVYGIFVAIIAISISLAIKSISKSKLYSRLYLIAYSAVALFSIISILDEYAIFDASRLVVNPILAGFGLEFTVLSIAIASKIYSNYYQSKNLLRELEEKIAKEEKLISEKGQLENKISKLEQPRKVNSTIKISTGQLISVSDVLYATSEGHYNAIFTIDNKEPVVFRGTFKELHEQLPKSEFLRVHRSYIVRLEMISQVFSNSIQLSNGKEIPVSRTYKPQLNQALDN
ncbi:MAG: LytTR family transcriptional regulator DNA-binding domain-containing protein [Bacteroidia bacterium]